VPSNAKNRYIRTCVGDPCHPDASVLQVNPGKNGTPYEDAKRGDEGSKRIDEHHQSDGVMEGEYSCRKKYCGPLSASEFFKF